MTTSAFRTALASVALALAVGLAGCGGGGGTTPDSGTGDGTGGGGSTGGGTGGGTGTLTIGPGFLPSSSAPVYASDTTRLGKKATEWFPPLTSVVHRAESGTTRPEAEPAEPFAIRSDGNGGFEVLFQDDGEETIVGLPVSAVRDGWIEYAATDDDGATFEIWTGATLRDGNDGTQGLRDYRYLHVFGSQTSAPGEPAEHFRMVFGLRTPADGLPAGTATYEGYMSANSWSASDSSNGERQRVSGDLDLVADFDAASLTGRIDGIRGTMPGAASSTRVAWPDTGLDIDNGKIVDGQFTATLTGYDTSDPVTPQSSLDGFAGDLVGEFYGPSGEELGGVLTAVREAAGTADGRVLEGHVLGRKEKNFVGNDSAPLSAGVIRYDYSGSSPRVELQDTDDGATAVARDANGDHRLTYQLDGETRTVTLTADDWNGRSYDKREGRLETYFWRQHSDAAYMNVVGWAGGTYPDDASTDPDTYDYGFAVFGDRTAAGQMPGSGTATYSGRTGALAWQPSPGQGQADSGNATRYRADLSLTADFGQGTIGGQVTGLERRAPGESGYTSVPGALTFDSGRIAGNTLTATLEGLGYSGSAEGAFYGPDAFEVGGVMHATHTDGRLLHGWFAGEKDD